jgi:hypothetical protein
VIRSAISTLRILSLLLSLRVCQHRPRRHATQRAPDAPFGECFLLDLDPLLLKRRHDRGVWASGLPGGALCAVAIGVQGVSNVGALAVVVVVVQLLLSGGWVLPVVACVVGPAGEHSAVRCGAPGNRSKLAPAGLSLAGV